MKCYPILFSAEMVRAILADRKTQTRRVMKPQPGQLAGSDYVDGAWYAEDEYGDSHPIRCPYGEAGDRLWVRETWRAVELDSGLDGVLFRGDNQVANSNCKHGDKWRPSIFMPRWASRITLENVGVRLERVQDISHEDATAEGVEDVDHAPYGFPIHSYAVANFRVLWDQINAKRGFPWASNPWVWVVKFEVAEVR